MADWVLFDLNGTLVDPSVLTEPEPVVHAAFDEANMMAMLTTLAGGRPPFKDLLAAALARRLELAGRDPGKVGEALGRLPEMPAYPDAAEALARLRSGGYRLAV